MEIQDGTGTGRKARVNLVNQLETQAVNVVQIGHVSYKDGNAFSLPFSQASNAGAADCILYLKNNDDRALIISQMWISCTAADEIYANLGMTGAAAGGTAPVPVNLNTASAKLANVTTRQHTAITGLSGGNMIFRSYFTANAISQRLYFDDAIILEKNGVWTLHVKTASANTVSGNVMFFFHEETK